MRILIIFMCLGIFASSQARHTNLDNALTSGSKKVDIVLYGKSLDGFGSYVNASVGLGYVTGFYYDIRGAISFRAAQSLFDSRNAFRGDFGGVDETIVGNSTILLDESFLEYFDGDTAIKAGRFQPINEYINVMIDGIWIRNASLKSIILEGMWAYRSGRVTYYEMQPFRRLGGDSIGWFDFGAKYFFSKKDASVKDSMYISIFGNFIPSVFGSVGVRWHSGFRLGQGETWLGIDAGFAASFEDSKNRFSADNNTFLFDAKASIGLGSWLDVFVGYVMSGKGGMGGINTLGVGNATQAGDLMFYKNIQPFFTWGGDAIKFGRNAKLVYAASRISLFDNKLRVYAAYGMTIFDGYSGRYGNNNISNIIQNELNVMAEFSITSSLSIIAYISDTHFAKGAPNNFQVNGGFRFMF
ncbi:hypothetical protein [Helicobacter muridarum]|uniref:Outer membrane protein n=2 Tax=Helicobacter muridarum TaxID=216 RepID=A0A377PXA6_9HELI|nr:hypothetical protein [Helicobacter muridarum]STQ86233.1 Uncharacterised protein [Helicobacter muridarum]